MWSTLENQVVLQLDTEKKTLKSMEHTSTSVEQLYTLLGKTDIEWL